MRSSFQLLARAETAEAALVAALHQAQQQQEQLQRWYGKQVAVASQLRKGGLPAPDTVGFTNLQR